MAKHSTSSKAGPLDIVGMILVLLTGSPAVAEGREVSLENDMSQEISIGCSSTKGHFDIRWSAEVVRPGRLYILDVSGEARFTCTFVAPGKPTTSFDVSVGWGGVKSLPCECLQGNKLGDICPWQITDNGFSCNSGKWSRTWGN